MDKEMEGLAGVTQSRYMRGYRIPRSISQLKTIAKYELINYLRTKRFYVLLVITLAISGLLTAVVARYQPAGFLSSSLGFYSSWWDSAVTVMILSGIFFGGDAISGEFQNKTGYFLIANPVKRTTIYGGKLVAAFIASLTILGTFAAVTVANGMYYFGLEIPYQFGLSLAFSVLYLISILGVTFFFSSLFKSGSISILVTMILFLFALPLTQTLVSTLAQTEPWFLITYGAEIIGNVLKDPYPAHVTTVQFGPTTFTTYNAPVFYGIAIMAAYFVVFAILGLIIFERRDFA